MDRTKFSFYLDFDIPNAGGFGSTTQVSLIYLYGTSLGTIRGSSHLINSGTINTNGDVTISLLKRKYMKPNPAWTGFFDTVPRYIEDYSTYYSLGNNDITVRYQETVPQPADAKTSVNITDKIENLATYNISVAGDILGEVTFTLANKRVNSKDGLLYNNETQQVGTIDYRRGSMVLDFFTQYSTGVLTVQTLLTDSLRAASADYIRSAIFRTAATKLEPSSLQVVYRKSDNALLTATSDNNGVITGTHLIAGSKVDTLTGKVTLIFDTDIIASSIKYDAIAETSLPLDPELLGLNPVRLPADGRVPVFKAGYFIIIFNEVTTAVINGGVPVADQINTLARSGQAYIEVIDVDGKRLDPLQYVADRVTGTVTFANPFTAIDKYGDALTAPFSIVDRIEDLRLATDVQINGLITLSEPLAQAFSAGDTKVASALIWGDTGARVYGLFSQEIWNSGSPVWSDELIGDLTTAQYDDTNYPINIDNKSSSAGRWAVIFTSPTTVSVANEKLGFVAQSISISIDDVAPINPATLAPYFIMLKEGFGSGWQQDNVIRFNTDSGENNMWVIRTIESGALSELTDSIDVEVRGDAN